MLKRLGIAPLLLVSIYLVLSMATPARGAGPTCYWGLDEGSGAHVSDSIGSQNGTLHAVAWTPAAIILDSTGRMWDLGSGKSGPASALDFSGMDSYLEVSDSPVLNSSEFSVIFWASPDSSGDWANLMGKQYYDVDKQAGWMVCWDAGSPRMLRLIVYSSSHTESSSPPVPMDLGKWAHLAFTVGNGSISAYKNGELVGRSPLNGYLPSSELLRIGKASGSSNYFDGMVDEVLFYSSSLGDNDIRSLYQSYNVTTSINSPTAVEVGSNSAIQGQEIELVARLLDKRGRVVVGAHVYFHLDGQSLGDVSTDSRGYARQRFLPQEASTHNLAVTFGGVNGLDGSAKTVQLTVTQAASMQQYLLYAGVVAAIVLGVVMVLILSRRREPSSEELAKTIRDGLKYY